MINLLSDRSKNIMENIKDIKDIKYIRKIKKTRNINADPEINLNKRTEQFLQTIYESLTSINSDLSALNYDKIREIIPVSTQLLSSNYKNKYMSDEIYSYINKKSLYKIKYTQKFGTRNIHLIFIVYSEKEINKLHKYDRYANNVFLILNLLFQYASSDCSKNQFINIFMTPFKREIPLKKNLVLGPNNVNGGMSYVCPKTGDITIYRKQEWFKVLIHESFHNLGFDFSTMNLSDFNKDIYSIFSINSEFNIYESYCEFWALVLNVIVNSFLVENYTSNYNNFLTRFKEFMFIEQTFTYIQVNKILDYIGLTYKDLFENSGKREKYSENTNVFAYYICKMILISDYDKFIVWCIENNTNYFNFKKTDENLDKFFQYILKNYKSENLINNINIISRYIINGREKNILVKTRKYKRKNKERNNIYRENKTKNQRQDKIKTKLRRNLSLTGIELK